MTKEPLQNDLSPFEGSYGQGQSHSLLPDVIEIGEGLAVNARDLHAALGVGKHFSSWIKDRIETYRLIENQDFEVLPSFGKNPEGGRPRIEYALKLSVAKELAMVENNEKGRSIRQYFIECENKLKEKFLIPKDYPSALRKLADQCCNKQI